MRIKMMMLLFALSSVLANAQTVDVKGVVKDAATGDVLPGVSITIKGTISGTETDFDGLFNLSKVQKGAVLVFNYLGYKQAEVVVNREIINVSLDQSAVALDEIVVIGYGTQRKKESTGAVSVIDSKDIEKLNPQRVEQALQGQIAGVNVTSGSGSPGAGSNIRIRGVTTNGDNRPLILVDGNVIEDLSVINPNDIKSMNVLKDATAGIYGVRGANGVILITTKTGRKNSELKFQFDAYTGIQTTSSKIDLLNPRDFAIQVNDAANETRFFVYPQTGTDWQDEVFREAVITSANFSASGGTEKASYTFGISHLDQDGIVGLDKSNFRRTTVRVGFNYDIFQNLKLSTTALLTNSKKNNLPENGIGSVLYNAINMNPNSSIFDENGDFSKAEDIAQAEIRNPLAQIKNTHNTTRVDRYSGTIGLDYTFLKNFTVSSKLQMNYSTVLSDVFFPVIDFGNGFSKQGSREINEVVDNSDRFYDYTWDNYINYTNTFGEDHDLTVLLGTSIFKSRGNFSGDTGVQLRNGSNSVSDALANGYIGDRVEGAIRPRFIDAAIAVGSDQFDSRLSSIFTRAQYSYKSKYLFSAVLRRDVSSNFSTVNNNNVGYFPSGSIGWNVSDEAFLQDSNWINSFKLRASYGIIGNDRIAANRFITLLDGEATVDPGGSSVTEVGDLVNGVGAGVLGNPDLQWEQQETANIGFDARLFNNKINLTADAFRKQTKDLLFDPQASGVIGATAPGAGLPLINAGTVENKGFEFKIGYDDNFSEDFRFNISYNVTFLDNEVTSLNGLIGPRGGEFGVGINQNDISRMEVGLPLGYFHGYKTDGLHQTQAEIDLLNAGAPKNEDGTNGVYHEGATPGDLKFVDTNGDGTITNEDRTNIGDAIADITMGFNIGFTYKKIDFSANAFASIGNDMVRDYERIDLFTNKGSFVADRWQGTGTSNTVPRASSGGSINTDLFSDYYVEDASFVRLQNVQVGYTFSENQLASSGIDKVRIYVSGNNIFTITDYKGYDPSAGSGSPIGNGFDRGFYPVAAMYLVGLNLNF
jgi:TonB-linked SusC/RagA family outer membrane protein